MPREAEVYLEDILTAVGRIQEYVDGLDRAAFKQDARTLDAVLHNLEVIGEAAKNLPEPMRSCAPEIEWRKIAGMRDLIAHAYFQIDPDIVWDIATTKLGVLAIAARRLLGR